MLGEASKTKVKKAEREKKATEASKAFVNLFGGLGKKKQGALVV